MAKKRNVGLEIALSLGGGLVFAIGLGFYIVRSMPTIEPTRLVSDGGASGKANAPNDLELSAPVFEAFGAELAAKNYEAAYARMAQPYRDAFSLAAFRAACERSPFLSRTQRAGLLRTTRLALGQAPHAATAQPAAPTTVRGQGVLATDAGSIEAAVTLLVSEGHAGILVLSLGGIPVLDGVSGAPVP